MKLTNEETEELTARLLDAVEAEWIKGDIDLDVRIGNIYFAIIKTVEKYRRGE